MKPKVPWTKTMLEKFIEEALLNEDEEKILRTRIAGWSIIKQSLEFQMSTATVSRIINNIKHKYEQIQPMYPNIFPKLKQSKYEDCLDSTINNPKCKSLLNEFETSCGKDIRTLTAKQIIACQKNCPYDNFYK